jgi:fucose permease
MGAIAIPVAEKNLNSTDSAPTYRGPFSIMTVLFFMWGFMTVFNDILIPRFKEAFTLDYYHAMFVQLAFFGAYFIGSLAYFIISATTGDPIARIGYKNGVVIGLFTSIGFPSIFSLALDGIGIFKSQASSLLVMAILGGALLPPLQGKIADFFIKGGNEHGLQYSFIVPLIAYAYVAFYGWKGHKIGRQPATPGK